MLNDQKHTVSHKKSDLLQASLEIKAIGRKKSSTIVHSNGVNNEVNNFINIIYISKIVYYIHFIIPDYLCFFS